MSEHVTPRKTYVLVWAALIVLTVATALVSRFNLGQASAAVAILIAACKASLVLLFFMAVKYEHQRIVIAWIVAGVFWLSILLMLSMTDYATRGFLNIPGR